MSNSTKGFRYIKYLGYLILGVIVFFLVYTAAMYSFKGRCELGDMYGAFNALFSGLAFSALVITIYIQVEELKFTRDEFIKSTKALSNQAETMDKQFDFMKESYVINASKEIIEEDDQDSLEHELAQLIYKQKYRTFVVQNEGWAYIPDFEAFMINDDLCIVNKGIRARVYLVSCKNDIIESIRTPKMKQFFPFENKKPVNILFKRGQVLELKLSSKYYGEICLHLHEIETNKYYKAYSDIQYTGEERYVAEQYLTTATGERIDRNALM